MHAGQVLFLAASDRLSDITALSLVVIGTAESSPNSSFSQSWPILKFAHVISSALGIGVDGVGSD